MTVNKREKTPLERYSHTRARDYLSALKFRHISLTLRTHHRQVAEKHYTVDHALATRLHGRAARILIINARSVIGPTSPHAKDECETCVSEAWRCTRALSKGLQILAIFINFFPGLVGDWMSSKIMTSQLRSAIQSPLFRPDALEESKKILLSSRSASSSQLAQAANCIADPKSYLPTSKWRKCDTLPIAGRTMISQQAKRNRNLCCGSYVLISDAQPPPRASSIDGRKSAKVSFCCDIYMALQQIALGSWNTLILCRKLHNRLRYNPSSADWCRFKSTVPGECGKRVGRRHGCQKTFCHALQHRLSRRICQVLRSRKGTSTRAKQHRHFSDLSPRSARKSAFSRPYLSVRLSEKSKTERITHRQAREAGPTNNQIGEHEGIKGDDVSGSSIDSSEHALSPTNASADGERSQRGNHSPEGEHQALADVFSLEDLDPSMSVENDARRYRLQNVQQPTIGCAFGTNVLGRLAIAPPLVIQLQVYDRNGMEIDATDELPFLICRVALATEEGSVADMVSPAISPEQSPHMPQSSRFSSSGGSRVVESAGSNDIAPTPTPLRMLYGTLVASPMIFNDFSGRRGTYFVFPEISVRSSGRFRLRVTLTRMPMSTTSATERQSPSVSASLCQTITDPFEVVEATHYSAPHITDLTRHFARQGAGMLLPPSQLGD